MEQDTFLTNFTQKNQGLPGDGHDRAGARKRLQNSARKKKILVFDSLLNHFIHFQLQILPHMPSNSIKCKGNLWKIIPVALKYLIYAMQNSPCGTPQAHRSDLNSREVPHGSDR
jgi:hypothetical protein